MRKTYRYNNISFAVADETEVYFTVEFKSDGNSGQTTIDVPGNIDLEIEDSGTVFIGKGKDLRLDNTICFSNVDNKNPNEDEIRIYYKINGVLKQEHINPKSEEERPVIVLKINFPKL